MGKHDLFEKTYAYNSTYYNTYYIMSLNSNVMKYMCEKHFIFLYICEVVLRLKVFLF